MISPGQDPDRAGPPHAAQSIGHRVLRREATTSTMADARAELERVGSRAAHGTVVVAREQTEGRGTRGRTWITKKGRTLPLTMILTPEPPIARPAFLTLTAAVAMVEAGASLGADLLIRWPNDVVDRDGRKVAGILAEAIATEPVSFLVGVGINVLPTGIPTDDLHDPAGSVREAGGEVSQTEDLVAPLFLAINRRYSQLIATGPAEVRCAFESLSFLKDRVSFFRRGKDVVKARLRGLTDTLDLDLLTTDGARLTWIAEQVMRESPDSPSPDGTT